MSSSEQHPSHLKRVRTMSSLSGLEEQSLRQKHGTATTLRVVENGIPVWYVVCPYHVLPGRDRAGNPPLNMEAIKSGQPFTSEASAKDAAKVYPYAREAASKAADEAREAQTSG